MVGKTERKGNNKNEDFINQEWIRRRWLGHKFGTRLNLISRSPEKRRRGGGGGKVVRLTTV